MMMVLSILFACGLNNTMYNARKYFRDAQARPLNSNGRPTPQAVDEYTKTIQKCGMILTESKDSKIADDALFLMAKALYFKGNSAFQAKDQFEALISGFPNSPHIPDAYILLARVLREINSPQESEKLLEEFVRNKKFVKHHPRALLTLTEFEIADKDFYRAQFWLERLIKEYPKTKEFNEAYLLFGRNYYVQQDYAASLRELEKLTGFRRVDKGIRLEARYYIALNHFEMGNYERSAKLVQSLMNDETRPDKLSTVRVLNARLQLNTGKGTDGLAEIDAIARAYPRTNASASAYYHAGDYHFYAKNDINQATTSYNRVRTEFPNSELVTLAQRKVSALNQLKQKQNLNIRTNPQQYADYHTLAAENYLDPFALPDSALAMYDRIILAAEPLYAERDSLVQQKASLQAQLDTLAVQISSLQAVTLPVEEEDMSDTQENAQQDTLNIDENPPSESQLADLQNHKNQQQQKIQRLEQQISSIQSVLLRYEMEIQPFAMFAKANLIHKLGEASQEIDTIYAAMNDKYPTNKYTNALRALRNGELVRLVDPEEERLERKLDYALGLYPTAVDSMLTILTDLVEARYPLIKLRANFRLGWHYSFEARDTTLAKPYLNSVLEHELGGEYAALTRRFYDGTNFVKFRDITVEEQASELLKDSDTGLDGTLKTDEKPKQEDNSEDKPLQVENLDDTMDKGDSPPTHPKPDEIDSPVPDLQP